MAVTAKLMHSNVAFLKLMSAMSPATAQIKPCMTLVRQAPNLFHAAQNNADSAAVYTATLAVQTQ